jgi:hypothetical protein
MPSDKQSQLKRNKETILMSEAGITQLLNWKAATGTKLTEEEWDRISHFVGEHLPGFAAFLVSNSKFLGQTKTRICILLRLYVGGKGTGTMLGVSSAYVSKASRQIVSRLFSVEGGGKELVQELCNSFSMSELSDG